MATNCIKVPRFLAQAAPRAVPRRFMCNSTEAAAAAALDRSTTNLRRVCTTWDTDLETHKHGGQAVRMGGLWTGCKPPEGWLSCWVGAAGHGPTEQSPVTQMSTAGLGSRAWDRRGMLQALMGTDMASPSLAGS